MFSPEAIAALYADSELPAMLVRVEKRAAIWQNPAAERAYPELRESGSLCDVFGVDDDSPAWAEVANGKPSEAHSTVLPPCVLNFVPMDGGLALVHLTTIRGYGQELIERMMQSLSYQIRTPLSSQLAMLNSLADGVDGEVLDRDIAAMRRCCYNILRAQTDVSAMSRVLADTEVYNMRVLDICAHMRQLCEAAAFLAIGVRIPFDYEIPRETACIRADPEKLTVSVLNILLNSFKYTRPGNQVRLELIITEAEARIIISDKGAGMPRETLERALEPFYSGAQSGGYSQSMGLGLTMAAEFAKKCGGSLRLVSVEGEGTVAMLMLPRCGEDENVTAGESAVDMLADRFSPLYVVMSEVITPPSGRTVLVQPK